MKPKTEVIGVIGWQTLLDLTLEIYNFNLLHKETGEQIKLKENKKTHEVIAELYGGASLKSLISLS